MSLEDMFANLAIQSVTMVGRMAFGAATSLAVRKISHQITDAIEKSKKTEKSNADRDKWRELEKVHQKFTATWGVVNPAIDLASSISSTSSSLLSSLSPLVSPLQSSITSLLSRLQQFGITPEFTSELKEITNEIQQVTPLITLALQVNGVTGNSPLGSLNGNGISYGRLMQASRALGNPDLENGQIDGVWKVRVYTLFSASARKGGNSNLTWKEDYSLAAATVTRTFPIPSTTTSTDLIKISTITTTTGSKLSYTLNLLENLNDGRVHESVDPSTIHGSNLIPGRERSIPVEKIEKMWWTWGSALLKVGMGGMGHGRVVIMKINFGNTTLKSTGTSTTVTTATAPRGGAASSSTSGFGTPGMDSTIDWIALEEIGDDNENSDNDDEREEEEETEEEEDEADNGNDNNTLDLNLNQSSISIEKNDLESNTLSSVESQSIKLRKSARLGSKNKKSSSTSKPTTPVTSSSKSNQTPSHHANSVTPIPRKSFTPSPQSSSSSSSKPPQQQASSSTSPPLSLLEYVLRLAAAEISQGKNHLDICDETLSLYLNSVGQTSKNQPIGMTLSNPNPQLYPSSTSRGEDGSSFGSISRSMRGLGPQSGIDSPLLRKGGNLVDKFRASAE